MTKYRLDKDTPHQPGDDEINRQKDFKKLHANYERMTKRIYRKPLYKDPRTLISLLLVLIVLWLLLTQTNNESTNEGPTPPDTTASP